MIRKAQYPWPRGFFDFYIPWPEDVSHLLYSNLKCLSLNNFQKEVSIIIAEKVEEWNISTQSEKNQLSAVGAVVGATNPDALKFFREEMPHAWILAPGVGAQGGEMKDVLAIRKDGLGLLIPVSRAVLYASNGKDYAEKAREAIEALWEEQRPGGVF